MLSQKGVFVLRARDQRSPAWLAYEFGFGANMVDMARVITDNTATDTWLTNGVYPPLTTGEWHSLKIKALKGEISAYLDSQLVIHYIDQDPIAHGGIVLGLSKSPSSRVCFDEVLVTSIP